MSAEEALPKITPAQMREDLVFLRDVWAKQDQSFNPAQAHAFHRLVADTIAQADRLDAVAFWVQVSRAVALSGNGHTNINADTPPFAGLPIEVWWFRDGLYIVAAEPSHAELLGARIEKFGARTAEQALAAVAPFIAGNHRRKRDVSPLYLRIPALLHRLGMAESDTEATLTVRLRDGTHREVTLPPEAAPDPAQHDADNWGVLIPSDRHARGRWAHVLDGVVERPWIYQAPVDLDSRWVDGDHHTLYIRSNRIAGSEDHPLALEWKLILLLAQEVVPNLPRAVIVDLRLNTGGNFVNTIPFAQALPKVLPPGGKVYVLVSASTFSAAIVTAAVLKDTGGPKVMLIGTGMGDNERFWAEGARVALPNSRLRIKQATGFQDWARPCTDRDRCFWANRVWGPKSAISLRPDIEIEPTFAEYASGHDTVLEKTLALARKD